MIFRDNAQDDEPTTTKTRRLQVSKPKEFQHVLSKQAEAKKKEDSIFRMMGDNQRLLVDLSYNVEARPRSSGATAVRQTDKTSEIDRTQR